MENNSRILERLSHSKFRNSFHLKQKDKEYIKVKGIDIIKSHAYDFINNRIKPSFIENDGKQTPYKGHPVFIAEHATATCCRGCIEKWYNIPKNRDLTLEEVDYFVSIIMDWIRKELD